MAQDHRPANYAHRDSRPHRRKVNRRTSNRETVQSDELSSTSGARLVSSGDPQARPYDPYANPYNAYHDGSQQDPHLSSTSLPAIDGMGTPHPKSPAARARQRSEHGANNPAYTGETYPVTSEHGTPLPGSTGAHRAVTSGHTGAHRAVSPSATGAHRSVSANRTGVHRPVPSGMNETQRDVVMNSQMLPRIEVPSAAQDSAAATPLDAQNAPAQATDAQPQTPHAPQERTYQDYTAASGRYKAHTDAPAGNTSSFKPLYATSQHARKRKKTWPRVVAAVAIIAAVVFGGYFGFEQIAYAGPVKATVNGEEMTLEGDQRSIEGLLDQNIVSVTPGNYVAVDNSVMREGDGTRCSALINETEVTDLKAHINEGDQVVVSNGTDVMEAYTDTAPTVTPAGYSKVGQWGALHVFLPGQDGETVTRTGSESGKTVDQVTKEKIDERLAYYNANSNGEKVIALTFDDGPWDGSTKEILDILKDNGAKATFYTIGQQIPSHEDLIKRMASEGHEIGTHTWDHADGSGKGVSLDLMSTTERQEEVQKGLDIIKETTGKDASIFFRAPGGNFNESTANDLKSLIDGEIGWNVDTEDWRRPGASVIAERIKSVKPGEVILMHDGGGDRSQTVAALREALPYLKNQGYKFVTISELIESYPYQEGQQS